VPDFTAKCVLSTLLYQVSLLNMAYGTRSDLGKSLHVDDLLHAREEVLVELLLRHDPVLVVCHLTSR